MAETSVEIQCTVDDLNPEWGGWVLEKLTQAGAQDAYLVPIYKKKNRPALLLSVLCPEDHRDAILAIIFRETTTLGVRWYAVHKERISFQFMTVMTRWGTVRTKVSRFEETFSVAPEYEDCKEIAERHHISLKQVYHASLKEALMRLGTEGESWWNAGGTEP
jgi:hypothetical protein